MQHFEKLWSSVFRDESAAIREALKNTPVNFVMPSGQVALHCAASSGSVNAIAVLMEAGANVNAIDKYGSTALMLACERGDFEVARELLRFGADASIRNDDADSPLDVAVQFGGADLVSLIASRTYEGNLGLRPFEMALMSSVGVSRFACAAVIDRAVQLGMNPLGDRTPDGGTLLHLAAEYRRGEICCDLIDRGLDPLAQDDGGLSALSAMAASDLVQPVAQSFEHGLCGRGDLLIALDAALEAGQARVSIYICEKLDLDLNEPSPENFSGMSLLTIMYHKGGDSALVEDVMRAKKAGMAHEELLDVFASATPERGARKSVGLAL